MPLGDVFCFLSGLYFRGKLEYARTFAHAPDEETPGVHIITLTDGLVSPDARISLQDLERYALCREGAAAAISTLESTARVLSQRVGSQGDVVLLGSVGTGKYTDLLAPIFGERLLFPRDVLHIGQLARGALFLRRARERQELPWVRIEKEYKFATDDGVKTLAELFDGRSQLLAYNIMFGPDYTLGACPGCTSLADGLDGSLVHLNHRDVTLLCFSRAPIERLTAYKRRMGWEFPYVSTYNSDFAFDFGLVLTEEQAEHNPEVKEMIDNPSEWLQEWSDQVGAEPKDGLREAPSWIAFARENGTVYHTYTVMAPDPFVAPYYSFLLERTPKAQPAEPRAWRKDEYPD